MTLLDKISNLFNKDDAVKPSWTLKDYVWFRLLEYDSEKPNFKSFDDYIDFCLNMVED